MPRLTIAVDMTAIQSGRHNGAVKEVGLGVLHTVTTEHSKHKQCDHAAEDEYESKWPHRHPIEEDRPARWGASVPCKRSESLRRPSPRIDNRPASPWN